MNPSFRAVGDAAPPRPELLGSAAFLSDLGDFEPVEDALQDDRVIRQMRIWLANPQTDPAACAFLSARLVQTLVWALVLPTIWVSSERLDNVKRVTRAWFAAGGLDVQSVAGVSAAMLLRAIAQNLATTNARRLCAPVLARILKTSTTVKAERKLAAAEKAMRFPVTVPTRIRDVVCLLGRMGFTEGVRVPTYVLPPGKLALAAHLPVLVFIARAPKHVPGLAFERTFAEAVFADADRPSLHEALVFCTEDWAREWRARGWSTSRTTQRALLRLHRSEWRFTPADALALICP